MILAANKMPDDALIAAMRGMKLRKDRTRVLKDIKVPVLFIIGLQDSRFPVSRAWEIVTLPSHSEVLLLNKVAHMGFIEDEKATLNAVRSFACNVLTSR
jgi:pimeloyl-ACP methyl ester carboxylesterase